MLEGAEKAGIPSDPLTYKGKEIEAGTVDPSERQGESKGKKNEKRMGLSIRPR